MVDQGEEMKAIYLALHKSLRHEMLIITTGNLVQIQILLDNHTTNWRVRTEGDLLVVKSTSTVQGGQCEMCVLFNTYTKDSIMQ